MNCSLDVLYTMGVEAEFHDWSDVSSKIVG